MREYNIHTSGLYRICAGSVTLCKPKSQEEHEKEQLTLKFKSYRKTIKHPFTIVADTECILEPKEDADESDAITVKTAVHIPCTASYLLSSHLPGYENEQVQVFHGIDCIDEFLESINVLYERLRPVLEMVKPMEKVDQATLALLDSNPNCAICESKHTDKKHLDHCHYTGKVLGYTHLLCNLERQTQKYILIFFHNLKGYDSHEIINFRFVWRGESYTV